MIALAIAVAGRRPQLFAFTALTIFSADLVSLFLKGLVERPRPFLVDDGDPEPLLLGVVGDSFPSGHAATSFAGAMVLAPALPGRWPVLFVLAAAIAFSRVYVGVHYPADVIVGAALGAFTALLLRAAIRRRSRPAPPPG